MLDQWFISDIETNLKQGSRFVIIDEQNQCDFLLDLIKHKMKPPIYEARTEIDELSIKYTIEKKLENREVIVFSAIPYDKLKFLREYCETSGCLKISQLHRYITQKVHEHIGFDLTLDPSEIVAIGKVSMGRGKDYWKTVQVKGKDGIFEMDQVLAFLANPEKQFKTFGKEGGELFLQYLSQHLENPVKDKPVTTIASELAQTIFDTILHSQKNPFIERLYKSWMDSKTYEPSLLNYASKYSISGEINGWQVSVNHPFKNIDEMWLDEVMGHLKDKEWLQRKLPVIERRAKQGIATLLGVDYWKAIYGLLSYDSSKIETIKSLNDAITHYTKAFHRVDNSMRKLFTTFLSEPTTLIPFQVYYDEIARTYLSKWFKYFLDQYQETQTGLLQRIIKDNTPPIAIIVGDAISFEIAHEIITGLSDDFQIKSDIVCGNFPSITENNMSALFIRSGEIYPDRTKRHELLQQETNNTITFQKLDEFGISHKPNDYTVFYSADVDELSEKQNQNALKYYSEFIQTMGKKIRDLFASGYLQVFLVSDHGFVLTGILDESEKIPMDHTGIEKAERYCLSKVPLQSYSEPIIEIKKPYKDFTYQYYASTLHPFKTKGTYGFAHGGVSPQELLIPYIEISKQAQMDNRLSVAIANKSKLTGVVGNNYEIVLKAGSSDDMFSSSRKIQLIFLKGKDEFNTSALLTIEADGKIQEEHSFSKYDEFKLLVVDANSRVTLDECMIKRKQVRDLGGLGDL